MSVKYRATFVIGAIVFILSGYCVASMSSKPAMAAVSTDSPAGTGLNGFQGHQYPILANPSTTSRIDSVIESEGIYCIYNGTAYGFMTEEGKEITSYDYENAYPFSEDLACVSREGKYGFIDKKGGTVLSFIYDDSAPFQEGLAYFSIGDKYGFMNKSGNPVFYLDCDSVSSFKEGMAYISVGGKYGYIDHTGKTVIEPVYEDAGYFQDGFADIVKDGRHGIINKNGNEIITPDYDTIERQEGIFIVQAGGSYGCFDETGKVLLPVDYDQVSVQDDMILIWKDGKAGLADLNGTIVLAPSYQSVQPVPGKPYAVVEDNNLWGFAAYQGDAYRNTLYQFPSWERLSYDYLSCSRGQEKNVLTYMINGKMGCMSIADFSELVPGKYDNITEFVHGRAVLQLNGKYGVVNTTGVMALPVVYDRIKQFANGCMAVTQNGVTSLLDSKGAVLNTVGYDSISLDGACYEIEAGGKTGYLDEKGRESILPKYDYVRPGSNLSPEVKIAACYEPSYMNCIIKTGETEKADLSKVLLRNKITPKINPFQKFELGTERKGELNGDTTEGDPKDYPEGLDMCDIKTYKLYAIDGSEDPILYFYAEPVTPQPRPVSSSGFYSIKNGELHKLITGYECGGTLGGNYVRLWYDEQTQKTLIGTQERWGGFGGRSYGGIVYEYKNGEAAEVCSFEQVNQMVGNYDKKDLLDHASLFYDEDGKPYNRESISQAGSVIEYTVNGTRTMAEEYEKAARRYR